MNFTGLVDLAAERLGGTVLSATDEFFAPKENLLKPGPAISLPEKYIDTGKWMDGWETRRHRAPDHNLCLIRLGAPGIIRGVRRRYRPFQGQFPGEMFPRSERRSGMLGGNSSALAPARRCAEPFLHRRSVSLHAPAPPYLSRWRRRPSSRAWRSSAGSAGRFYRSCGGGKRGQRRRSQRHVFRLAPQPDFSRTLHRDARRMGNAPQPGRTSRLVPGRTRSEWRNQGRRSGYAPLQGKFSGELRTDDRGRRRDPAPRSTPRPLSTRFRKGAAAGRGLARPLPDPSRRRRQPAADLGRSHRRRTRRASAAADQRMNPRHRTAEISPM